MNFEKYLEVTVSTFHATFENPNGQIRWKGVITDWCAYRKRHFEQGSQNWLLLEKLKARKSVRELQNLAKYFWVKNCYSRQGFFFFFFRGIVHLGCLVLLHPSRRCRGYVYCGRLDLASMARLGQAELGRQPATHGRVAVSRLPTPRGDWGWPQSAVRQQTDCEPRFKGARRAERERGRQWPLRSIRRPVWSDRARSAYSLTTAYATRRARHFDPSEVKPANCSDTA